MKDEYKTIIKSTNKFTAIKLLCDELVYSIAWIYQTEDMFEQKVKQQAKEYQSLAYKYNTELKEDINLKITIKNWITYEESEKYKESCGGMGGWFNSYQEGHRWKDYIEIFDDEMKPYLEVIRKEVIENNYKFGGDTHQDNMTPLFSDNTVGSFSYRAWGDLMAAIWSEEEDKDYCYMDFYMTY